jgi:hypothetical protein
LGDPMLGERKECQKMYVFFIKYYQELVSLWFL